MTKTTTPAMLCAALAMLLTPSAALATCTLGLSALTVTPAYDMMADTDLGLVVEFEVTHANGDACSYFVTFSGGGAGTYDRRMAKAGDVLAYQLYDSASKTNVLKEKIDATINEVLSGTVTSAETSPETLTYYLAMPKNQMKPDGSYSDSFTLTLYEGTLLGTNTEVASHAVAVTAALQKQVELCLVNTGAAFDRADTAQSLDFGVLTEGEALGFDARVRTNAGFSVTVLSANRGALKLRGQTARASTTVPYTLKVDDVAKDLSGTLPVEIATGSGQTAISGVARHLTVVIGAVTGKASGTFEDSVTFTISTTE